jgi:periplasmic protein TonB
MGGTGMSTPAQFATERQRPATQIAIWSGSVLVHAALLAVVIMGIRAVEEPEPEITPPVAIQVALAGKPAAPAPQPKPVPPAPAKPVARHSSPPVRPTVARPSPAPAPAAPAQPVPAPAQATQAEPAPAAPPAPPAPAVAEPVTPPIGNAAYLHNPPPRYPAEAQDNGWTGRAVVRVHVDPAGHPLSVELHTSSGHAVLDKAAIAAVQKWSFVPAKRGTTPVDGWVDVPLDFHLD